MAVELQRLDQVMRAHGSTLTGTAASACTALGACGERRPPSSRLILRCKEARIARGGYQTGHQASNRTAKISRLADNLTSQNLIASRMHSCKHVRCSWRRRQSVLRQNRSMTPPWIRRDGFDPQSCPLNCIEELIAKTILHGVSVPQTAISVSTCTFSAPELKALLLV